MVSWGDLAGCHPADSGRLALYAGPGAAGYAVVDRPELFSWLLCAGFLGIRDMAGPRPADFYPKGAIGLGTASHNFILGDFDFRGFWR